MVRERAEGMTKLLSLKEKNQNTIVGRRGVSSPRRASQCSVGLKPRLRGRLGSFLTVFCFTTGLCLVALSYHASPQRLKRKLRSLAGVPPPPPPPPRGVQRERRAQGAQRFTSCECISSRSRRLSGTPGGLGARLQNMTAEHN